MIEIIAALTLVASSTPSTECLAAARRFTEILVAEAKGTRHETQIRQAAEKAGGMDKSIAAMAAAMDEKKCAFLLTAPDSSLRALAITSLPERNGK
jgi:hypothetical protein